MPLPLIVYKLLIQAGKCLLPGTGIRKRNRCPVTAKIRLNLRRMTLFHTSAYLHIVTR